MSDKTSGITSQEVKQAEEKNQDSSLSEKTNSETTTLESNTESTTLESTTLESTMQKLSELAANTQEDIDIDSYTGPVGDGISLDDDLEELDEGIETELPEALSLMDVQDNQAGSSHAGFVAIVGKPNVGKSTLLNTMLGVKVAPISSKPQTTRRGVRGIYTDHEENRQLIFVDTPGLHRSRDGLGSYMNREIRHAVIDVDTILWVVDLRRPPVAEDKDVARLINDTIEDHSREDNKEIPVYLVGNKLDAAKYPEEAIDYYRDLCKHITQVRLVSAKHNPNAVYALRDELLDTLPENPYFFPDNIRSDQSREHWAAEIIRESCMVHLRQELPYSIAVNVVEWRESTKKKPLYMLAEIWVEQTSHRMMIIGKGGKMIREIGKTARKQLEVFLSEQVYLDLEIILRADWRDDVTALRELGYE